MQKVHCCSAISARDFVIILPIFILRRRRGRYSLSQTPKLYCVAALQTLKILLRTGTMAAHFFVPKYNVSFDSFSFNTGIIADITNFFSEVKANFVKRAAEKRTYRELQALSAHELQDIGISRSDIMAVSKGIFND